MSADRTSPDSTARRSAFQRVVDVVARLRAPDGCPWDREQTHESLTPYVVEEAHEVVEAIHGGDRRVLCEELGDLLLQVVLHAQVSQDDGGFTVDDVCAALESKLVERHPHVFGDAAAETAADVTDRWERIKAEERKRKGDRRGTLAGVPRALPALLKAQRLTEKAGRVGFDWPDSGQVIDKIREEVEELAREVEAGDGEAAGREFGDLLFALANLARHLDVDAEGALQRTNGKFFRRFEAVERRLEEAGSCPREASLEEMERLWQEAKANHP